MAALATAGVSRFAAHLPLPRALAVRCAACVRVRCPRCVSRGGARTIYMGPKPGAGVAAAAAAPPSPLEPPLTTNLPIDGAALARCLPGGRARHSHRRQRRRRRRRGGRGGGAAVPRDLQGPDRRHQARAPRPGLPPFAGPAAAPPPPAARPLAAPARTQSLLFTLPPPLFTPPGTTPAPWAATRWSSLCANQTTRTTATR